MIAVFKRAIIAISASLVFAACSTTPQLTYLIESGQDVQARGAVADPVFYTQRTNECGPAALAMTLAHTGLDVTPDELVDQVYLPGREGSIAPSLVAAARRHGRVAYPIHGLQSMFTFIDENVPILVLQNLGLSWYPKWHYAVVIGYDLGTQSVTLHSGETPNMQMSMATFERTWARSGYWAIAALKPDKVPRTALEEDYVQAVAGVERAQRFLEAAKGYESALARWPNNRIALMGAGNALYQSGDMDGAAQAFDRARTRLPDNADAHNNYAHVMAMNGDLAAAEIAARRAVELGGENQSVYLETLQSIEAAKRPANNVSGG